MLHLSFTQQLCHVAKINQSAAANDAIFGLSSNNKLITAAPAPFEALPTPYLALRKIAQRCLKNKL